MITIFVYIYYLGKEYRLLMPKSNNVETMSHLL